VLLNSGAAFVVAGRASGVEAGIELAARSIDSGAAQRVLDALVTRTNVAATAEAVAR
jgi:anthranilate phosphoribosyltransferase